MKVLSTGKLSPERELKVKCCHCGNPHDIYGARRDVRILKTI